MRIISKFHDYYDSVRSFGFDPNIIYTRKTEELKLTLNEQKILKHKKFNFSNFSYWDFPLSFRYVTIAFCGDIYRGFELFASNPQSIIPKNYGYVWSFEKLIKVFPKIINYFSKSKRHYFSKSKRHFSQLNELNFKDYFVVETKLQSVIDLHLKYKSPVITLRTTELNENIIEKDISLKSIGFQQVMDTYMTFQKLSIFVGNILISQSKVPWPISDKLKAQSKGFDEYSFRKRPTQKHE